MKPTDIANPDYFHKVVDCQWACPAHTPVPEYIRLIAAGRYGDAYMVNWESNVFPGILGRTCDRPCEPACRRGRVEEGRRGQPPRRKPEPVAICRLKRVAADYKDDIRAPAAAARGAKERQAHRAASAPARPRSPSRATWRRSATNVVVFDGDARAGGMIRSQIPKFRLPEAVIDEEVGYILDLGVEFRAGTAHRQPEGAARRRQLRRDLRRQRRAARARPRHSRAHRKRRANIHIGIDWLASVSFGHITQDRQARDRARRRQHGDGLLPQLAAPGRRGRARSSCAPASTR